LLLSSHTLAPNAATIALWLAAILRLARDSFKRASHPLVRANKPAQKPQDVYDKGDDASEVDQDEEYSNKSCNWETDGLHIFILCFVDA
jgi:hypothetical protein